MFKLGPERGFESIIFIGSGGNVILKASGGFKAVTTQSSLFLLNLEGSGSYNLIKIVGFGVVSPSKCTLLAIIKSLAPKSK